MEQEFITYKTFYDLETAYELVQVLEENKIPYRIEQLSSSLNPSLIGNPFELQYIVKLNPDDFEKTNLILQNVENITPENIDKNLPILQFSNEELFEIINKPDEWSNLDIQMAKILLKQRGQNIDDKFIADARNKRIAELSLPKTAPNYLVFAGYLLAILGGLFGILIGIYLFSSNKTLPNGKVVYDFDDESRLKGKRIINFSVFVIIVVLLMWISYALLLKGIHWHK